MNKNLRQDLDWFFQVYQNNTSNVVNRLPEPARQVLISELHLLMDSVFNRLEEEAKR